MENGVINGIMDKTLDNLRELVDTDTVIGKCILSPDGSMVVPVSKVSVGMVAGGGEYNENSPKLRSQFPGAGGGGAGVSITPLGFLVLSNSKHSFIRVDKEENESKWMDLAVAATKVFTKNKN